MALIAVDSDYQEICLDRDVGRAAIHANGPPVWRYLYTHRYENHAFLNTLRAFHTAELRSCSAVRGWSSVGLILRVRQNSLLRAK
jgi:hypothetical protein